MRYSVLFPLMVFAGCTGSVGVDDSATTDDSGLVDSPTDSSNDSSNDSSTDSSNDSSTDSEDSGVASIHATITGTVKLVLYTTDEYGDIVELSWLDAYPAYEATNGYPFGSVFLGAFTEAGNGIEVYHGNTLVGAPNVVTGDAYSISVTLAEAGSVRVYAVADAIYTDGIMATFEPSAVSVDEIELTDGATVSGVDLTILVPYQGGDGGGGGSGGCDTVTVSGDVTVTQTWVDGDVAALIYDSNGEGPHYADRKLPVELPNGADAPYSMTMCSDFGTAQLLGAWDSNGNGVIEPADRWGAYVSAPLTNGNPIAVGQTDLTGYDIEIPFGDVQPNVVPYVAITGTITSAEAFAYPAGTSIHVGAMKYKATPDMPIATLEANSFDVQTFTDFSAGQLSYMLIVPANTVAYVWAYADTNGNAVINETGEPVGGTGKLGTGTQSQVQDFMIQAATQ